MKFKFLVLLTVIGLICFSMSAMAAPMAPTLTYSVNGLTITASWTSVPEATGYKLSYAPSPYTGPESIGSLDVIGQTSFTATLWEGAAFYIAVQANDGQNLSEFSNIENFTLATLPLDLTGSWNFVETSGPNNCEEAQGQQTNYIGTITQTDTSITAQFGGGSFSGSLVGNTINLSGSMPEDEGTTTSTINISVLSGNSLSGSTSWSWSDGGGYSCSGTSSISGSR